MYLTGVRLGFAARSMGYEMEQENVMLIRIRRHANKNEGTQVAELEGIIAVVSGALNGLL